MIPSKLFDVFLGIYRGFGARAENDRDADLQREAGVQE